MTGQMHLADKLPIAYFIYDKDYKAVDCNREAVYIFAADKGRNLELVRTYLISHERYIHPDYETTKAVTERAIQFACEQALEKGKYKHERVFVTLSGREVPCEVTVLPLNIDGSHGYVHYIQVLSKTAHALARMSHEIRTAVQTVSGIADMLLGKDSLPIEVLEDVARINASSGVLMKALEEILELDDRQSYDEDIPHKTEYTSMPEGRVLVVDDVESNLYVAQGMLEHYQIKVDTAASGTEALAKVETGTEYDIIFMDLLMPDMDGEQATHAIRKLGYVHPIIALSANVTDKAEYQFMKKGFDGFLGKPIRNERMEEYLTRFIRDKYK